MRQICLPLAAGMVLAFAAGPAFAITGKCLFDGLSPAHQAALKAGYADPAAGAPVFSALSAAEQARWAACGSAYSNRERSVQLAGAYSQMVGAAAALRGLNSAITEDRLDAAWNALTDAYRSWLGEYAQGAYYHVAMPAYDGSGLAATMTFLGLSGDDATRITAIWLVARAGVLMFEALG